MLLKNILIGVNNYENFEYRLSQFLESFYYDVDIREEIVKEEPLTYGDYLMNGIIAAVVEELCYRYKVEIPSWVLKKEFSGFDYPVIYNPLGVDFSKETIILYYLNSPVSFIIRNIFVSSQFLIRF